MRQTINLINARWKLKILVLSPGLLPIVENKLTTYYILYMLARGDICTNACLKTNTGVIERRRLDLYEMPSE